jgi:hypothetical protein
MYFVKKKFMRKNFTILLMLFVTIHYQVHYFTNLRITNYDGTHLQYGDTVTVSGTPQSSELIGLYMSKTFQAIL